MGKKLVVNGATLGCDQAMGGSATLTVLPTVTTQGANQPVATVQDFKPMVNIASFGVCQSMANPQVAAATAAAQGVLTPQPCVPVTTSPWTPGSSNVKIDEVAALTDDSTCMCSWTGTVTVKDAGTTTETLD